MHLSTPLLRQKETDRQRHGLNLAWSVAVDPEEFMKLVTNNVFHEPAPGVKPLENSCWEWNLEQSLWSSIPKSEEPKSLHPRTIKSPSWACLGIGSLKGQAGEAGFSWRLHCPTLSKPYFQRAGEDQQASCLGALSSQLLGKQLCC